MLRYVPCVPSLSKNFIMKGYWSLLNAFSVSNEMITLFLIFQLIYMVDYFNAFLYVEPFLHLWGEEDLIIFNDLWIVLGLSLKVFNWEFCPYVKEWDWSLIFFLGWVFVWLCYQDNSSLIKSLAMFLLFLLWGTLWGI